MCTLALRFLPDEASGPKVVIAANRDEFYARPASAPRIITGGPGEPPVLAPLDEKAGGTWLGVNGRGLAVGVTNRTGAGEPRPDLRSRGQLVLDALRNDTAERAAKSFGAFRPETANPFHLLMVDERSAYLLVSDGSVSALREVSPGVHVITNYGVDNSSEPKVRRLLSAFDPDRGGDLERLFGRLVEALGSHAEPDSPLANLCIHTEDYGTRSSTLIALGNGIAAFRFAPSAPCRSPYASFDSDLQELCHAAGPVRGF